MTTKKKSLTDYIRPAAAAVVPEPAANGASRSDDDLVPIAVKVSRANKKRLKDVANQEDTTLQELGVAGFNLILKARGLKPLD